jgi:hypothetical protein
LTLVSLLLSAGVLGSAAPASAHHNDPHCLLVIHPPVLGQVKVYLLCEHGR